MEHTKILTVLDFVSKASRALRVYDNVDLIAFTGLFVISSKFMLDSFLKVLLVFFFCPNSDVCFRTNYSNFILLILDFRLPWCHYFVNFMEVKILLVLSDHMFSKYFLIV